MSQAVRSSGSVLSFPRCAYTSFSSSPSIIAESFSFMSPPLVLACVEQRPELLGDCLTRAKYPRSHRPDRAVHDRRDVLVAQPLELAQRDGVAQLRGQTLERVVHCAGDLGRHQHALGRVDVAQLVAVL